MVENCDLTLQLTDALLKCCKEMSVYFQWSEVQSIDERLSVTITIKKYWQCKAGRGRLPPYQSEDPSPTLPTYRGKEDNGKIVEDKKGESN